MLSGLCKFNSFNRINAFCLLKNNDILKILIIFANENKTIMAQDNYFGYFKCPQNVRDISSLPLLQEMKDIHCSKIFMDDVGERSNWSLFCRAIENGGTAVLYSFDNALLDGGVDFRVFIKFCAMNEVRIISLGDKIDSEDILFPPRTSATLLTIANLSSKRNPGRFNDYREDTAKDTVALKRLKDAALVVNMYNAGYSLNDIIHKLGFKSKKSIYDILKKLAFPTNRYMLPRKTHVRRDKKE